MAPVITIEVALALLAFAAPVTAAILKYGPERKTNGHISRGEYQIKMDSLLTKELFRAEIDSMRGWVAGIERRLEYIEKSHINKGSN